MLRLDYLGLEILSYKGTMMGKITLEIDRARCRGHAMCISIAPTLIELGEDGLAHAAVEEVPASQMRQAEEVVGYCPELAVVLRTEV